MKKKSLSILFLHVWFATNSFAGEWEDKLLKEARVGNIKGVQEAIAAGADVNAKHGLGIASTQEIRFSSAKGDYGCTALHEAAKHGHVDTIRMLLEAGANIHITDNYGYTALHKAANHGNAECISLLLEAGIDVHAQGISGSTALHNASSKGHTKVVQMLLQANAKVNVRDKWGQTALHEACFLGHLEVIRLLLQANADVNIQDKRGKTALHIASGLGQTRSTSFIDGSEGFVLHDEAHLEEHSEIIRMLLKSGANVFIQDQNKETALHQASGFAHEEINIVRLLLEAAAHVNAQDKDGKTALHKAAAKGHLETIRILLQFGADPEITFDGTLKEKINAFEVAKTNKIVLEVMKEEHALFIGKNTDVFQELSQLDAQSGDRESSTYCLALAAICRDHEKTNLQ